MAKGKIILLTGANGLLGQKIADIFARESDHSLIITDVADKANDPKDFAYYKLDITDKEAVKELVKQYEPEVIINAAAFTNVDACETERELSWRINVDGVKNLIIGARINNSKLVHVSTDYIFDGVTGHYDEQSLPNPKSFYGKGKLAAENAIVSSGITYAIARTMILYGIGINVKPNFALWLIESLENKKPVNIVIDQYGMPTIIDDLALGILRIVEKDSKGIFNICGSECCTRYDFAIKLAEIFELDKTLISPILTADLKQPAERPMNSTFILLKAETELGLKPLNVTEGLQYLKSQLKM